MSRVVIEIPSLPLAELLLVGILVLLYRLLVKLSEAVALLHKLTNSSQHVVAANQDPKRATPTPPSRREARSRAQSLTGAGPDEDARPDARLDARLLQQSARKFASCLDAPDDVNVEQLLAAMRLFSKVLELKGSFTHFLVKEIHSNSKKIESSYRLNPGKYRSMRLLLEAEVASKMHQPDGILGDPSAAMGLLWARRGLGFWLKFYRNRLQELEAEGADSDSGSTGRATPPPKDGGKEGVKEPGSGLFPEALQVAYSESLAQFNGWITQNSMALAMRAVPATFPRLAASEEMEEEDMREWVSALERLLERMEALHLELDLEDKRKSI